MTYVDGPSLLISARVAAKWNRLLSAPRAVLILDYEDDPEEVAARAELRKLAKTWAAQVTASRRNDETPDDGLGAWSDHEWIDTAQAADLLGVSRRRVQQLAAGGMGRRDARGWWLLAMARVLAHLDEHGRCA
ncbi:hypothetical protein GCM10010517_36590 [Streptosporangium fragile]|uniref:Helix-turn-helix domain-containing protein n=1 Tax=Streptosporangium fragile TaxID=46186 RepID=A0ABP6IEG5_9ACTN